MKKVHVTGIVKIANAIRVDQSAWMEWVGEVLAGDRRDDLHF